MQCVIVRVFFLFVVPKNPNLHQGLSQCSMQMCINSFLSGQGKKIESGKRGGKGKKRKTASPDASQLHRANEHKCHCQAEMNKKCVTPAYCAGVGGQQDMFCIWRGECPRRKRERLCTCNKWVPTVTYTHGLSLKKKKEEEKSILLKRRKLVRATTMFRVTGSSEKLT